MRVSLFSVLSVLAGLVVVSSVMSSNAAEAEALPEQYQFVQDAFPEVVVTSVKPSPIPGLLQMSVGADLYYVSEDGEYFIMGDIFGLETRKNMTEVARSSTRANYLKEVGEDGGIMFPANDEEYVITVFTDIDCGYCRKLHREIDGYNEEGISVRYLFFPRRGPGSDSWAKADAVWCSTFRDDALTAAKSGVVVEAEDCGETPVAKHYQLGKDLGIVGTPAIFTAGGQLISGYHSPDDLLELLQDAG